MVAGLRNIYFRVALLLSTVLLAGCEQASELNVSQMIINIADTMPAVLSMVTAASYITGFVMVGKGVYKLKEYGELRTMMSSQTSIWPIVITFICGSMLIFFPTAIDIGMQTIFAYDSPLTYSGDADQSVSDLINAIVMIMQVIGAIAAMRGIILLNQSGSQSSQPGTFSKGMMFLIGGILAINTYGTWEVLVNTLT